MILSGWWQWAILLSAFVGAWGLTWWCFQASSWCHLLDHPNERSLHMSPIPRSGGIAFLLAIVLAWLAGAANGLRPGGWSWVVYGLLPIAAISLWDDLHGVRPGIRLLVHGAVAALLVAEGFRFAQLDLPGIRLEMTEPLAALVSFFFIVWMVNLYNFMDGMDGLAGGMAVAGFAALAVLGHLAGDASYAFANAAVVAGVAGFLLWNLPPARIFMGDCGAASLGLMVAMAVIRGSREEVFPLWAALLVFSPFLFDATLTLLRRLVRGERIWEPHRNHCYQRLVTSGWGQARTLAAAYLLILAAAGSALLLVHATTLVQWFGLALWALGYLAIAWLTRRLGDDRGPRGSVA